MNKLIFIGLGLYNSQDISLKGIEVLKNADHVFAEFYTSKMAEGTIQHLESLINKQITILTRNQVEDGDIILSTAKNSNVAFLCQGDPFTATTHIELILNAKSKGIETQTIHGASIASAVPGLLGLQFYKFGRTTTLAYPEGEYFPESPYDIISENSSRGLHTLVLLDINEKEKRYMTANEGIDLLLQINSKRGDDTFTAKTLVCVVSQAGSDNPIIAADEANELQKMDFKEPLHSIVVPGRLHFKEAEALIILAKAPKNIR
jgi:diphthine synthase